ncbi:MAG: hypothetical protein JKY08_02435 [Flavobacteriaceae bacterium]|nr:hypothetical protein [Flavobacteriaceae bacterium]
MEVRGGHTVDKSKIWLGKPLVINFGSMEFLGYITSVNLENKDGHNGNLILKGYSPTILLDGAEQLCSWVNSSLESIVGETLGRLNIGTVVCPKFKETIEYQVQYQENNYQFLQRLAKQYNEWFYYNGTQIIFGKLKHGEVQRVEYGRDLSEIQLEINVKDHRQTNFSYNATDHNLLSASSKNQVAGLNELGMHAFYTSSEIFTTEQNNFTNIETNVKSQIDELVARKQATASAGLHVMKAKSTKQGLTVGTVIKVASAKVDGKSTFDIQNYGEYMITRIIHTATERLEYFNTFEAIPSGITIPEEPLVSLPKAASQLATVISNNDPKGMGRVQVRFDWQRNTMKTSWLRVMSADAGSSENHAKNRGHVFVPEVNDQVMIGFEYNNPNRPFILGAMFHGENGAGGKQGNNIKTIITKSGHMIKFNDTPSNESITITDKKGNHVLIDTQNETISINALKDVNIIAGENINISAGKNIVVNAGENIDETAGRNISSRAGKDITISATEDFKQKSTSHTEIADKKMTRTSAVSKDIAQQILVSSTKKDIQLQSAKGIVHNSNDKTNLF